MAAEMDSRCRGNDADGGSSRDGNSGGDGGPLQGIRVVEMGQLIAIPFAMKLLADMGAQVIRLESTGRLESYRSDSVYQNEIHGEFWNRGANFYEQNRNKLGITLDLARSEGLDILRRLIAISDVFAENFTPRVIRNFDLEYANLRRIKTRHHHGVVHRVRFLRAVGQLRGHWPGHGGGVGACLHYRIRGRASGDGRDTLR